jgi:hypothetical protein
MADKPKKSSPPYATFGSFIGFLNKLRETTVPGRIDPSVFGNASGSISYSVIAALKFLNLIDDAGKPSADFIALATATDEQRPGLLKPLLQKGYSGLFKPEAHLATMTAGQFDEYMRAEYDVESSTIDKIASFFISAAKMADIQLSPHLMNRKPIASSSTSKKSAKQRKRDEVGEPVVNNNPPPPPPTVSQKALQYQLIDLMAEPGIEDDVKQSIWSLVQFLMAREAKRAAEKAAEDNA